MKIQNFGGHEAMERAKNEFCRQTLPANADPLEYFKRLYLTDMQARNRFRSAPETNKNNHIPRHLKHQPRLPKMAQCNNEVFRRPTKENALPQMHANTPKSIDNQGPGQQVHIPADDAACDDP